MHLIRSPLVFFIGNQFAIYLTWNKIALKCLVHCHEAEESALYTFNVCSHLKLDELIKLIAAFHLWIYSIFWVNCVFECYRTSALRIVAAFGYSRLHANWKNAYLKIKSMKVNLIGDYLKQTVVDVNGVLVFASLIHFIKSHFVFLWLICTCNLI